MKSTQPQTKPKLSPAKPRRNPAKCATVYKHMAATDTDPSRARRIRLPAKGACQTVSVCEVKFQPVQSSSSSSEWPVVVDLCWRRSIVWILQFSYILLSTTWLLMIMKSIMRTVGRARCWFLTLTHGLIIVAIYIHLNRGCTAKDP